MEQREIQLRPYRGREVILVPFMLVGASRDSLVRHDPGGTKQRDMAPGTETRDLRDGLELEIWNTVEFVW